MTTIRDLYKEKTNAEWPKSLPKLTAVEAERAGKRLFRMAFKKPCPYPVYVTSGRNGSYIRNRVLRVNPSQGWKEFIHGLSHSFFSKLHPTIKPHSGSHAIFERDMIRHVIAQGWLGGALKPAVKEPKAKPDEKAKRYALVLAGIARWEAKAKRAKNALAKLQRRKRYYEKAMGDKS